MPDSTGWTDERRQQRSEQMKQFWADPRQAAQQRAKLNDAVKRKWEDPDFKAKRLDQLLYQRCDPAYVNFSRIRLQDPAQAAKHADLLHRLNTDPVLVERKRAGQKRAWADPAFRARMAEVKRRNAEKRRGFRVPRSMWDEYERLRKAFSAREAGRILGLVK